MLKRCTDPDADDWDRYGGRGITVCPRWTEFANFFSDMGKRPKGLSLDRIDNNGNYEPDNCRWATPIQQLRNTRYNVNIAYRGKTQCIRAWSEEIGMKYYLIQSRAKLGWSAERIFETPVMTAAQASMQRKDRLGKRR